MTTAKVALNGLQRSLKYAEEQLESQRSLYNPGVENFEEIRRLAQKIVDLTDEILQISEEMEKQEKVIEKEVVVKKKEVEIIDDEVPQNFSKDFKQVLQNVASLPLTDFSSSKIKECADFCNEYFNVRFSKRYDILNLHKFNLKDFKNYLYSFLLTFADYYESSQFIEVVSSCYDWLEDVKSGNVKYTMPKIVSQTYFQVVKGGEYDSIDLKSFELIWDELWELGYEVFGQYNNSNFPEHIPQCLKHVKSLYSCDSITLESGLWNREVFEYALDSIEEETGIIVNAALRGEIKQVCYSWMDLSRESTYDLFRALAMKDNLSLNKLHYENEVKLSDGTLCKSLIFYIMQNEVQVDVIEKKIESIFKKIQFLDSSFSSISEKYENVKDSDVGELELVEVLQFYAQNYEVVCYEHSKSLIPIE